MCCLLYGKYEFVSVIFVRVSLEMLCCDSFFAFDRLSDYSFLNQSLKRFADVFPGSQTGFYPPGGAAQQTGTHYGLQGFGQHSQSLAAGSATPVGLQNYSSQFLSGSGLQIAAAAAQQFRNPTGALPGPANAAATFLSKHQQQEQPRQLKSPSGNQQDVLASVFSSSKLLIVNFYIAQ